MMHNTWVWGTATPAAACAMHMLLLVLNNGTLDLTTNKLVVRSKVTHPARVSMLNIIPFADPR